MKDVKICQYKLIGRDGLKKGKIGILTGSVNSENPIALMNAAVNEYVGTDLHNQFVEIHMDNPWVRVILAGINELEYEDFKDQRLNG